MYFQIGRFEYFDQDNQKFFPTKLATFYVHLPTGSQAGQSTYTVPYVDPFSGVGMYTCMIIDTLKMTLHYIVMTEKRISCLETLIIYDNILDWNLYVGKDSLCLLLRKESKIN